MIAALLSVFCFYFFCFCAVSSMLNVANVSGFPFIIVDKQNKNKTQKTKSATIMNGQH
jgi:hypothetical protein